MASKNKLLWTLVILLLAANTVTLVIFWTGRGKDKTMRPPQQLGDYLTEQLSLDSSQQQQYKQLIQAHRSAAAPLRRQIGQLKDSLFGLLPQGNAADTSNPAILAVVEKIGVATSQMELLHFNHFQQVRALCTPAQQQKFDGLLQEITRRMAMPPPGQRQPGKPGSKDRPGPPPPGERPDELPPPPGENPPQH